jgi:hypothetical protein
MVPLVRSFQTIGLSVREPWPDLHQSSSDLGELV